MVGKYSSQEIAMKSLLFLVVALYFPDRTLAKSPLLEKTLLSVFVNAKKGNVTCALPTVKQQARCFADPGIQGVLRHAFELVETCRENFMYEPWQCTTSKTTFKKGTRETAFLYALYTAALAYAVSQACASNKLASCHCTSGIIIPEFSPMVTYHLCPDDVEYGARFIRSFLNIDHEDANLIHITGRHNARIGLKVVKDNLEITCKALGSCNIKFCLKRLKPFSDLVQSLKLFYQSAVLWEQTNTVRANVKGKFGSSLLYTDQSSSQCDTKGRACLHRSHCAELCCGRGFNTRSQIVYLYCHCGWGTSFKLGCDVCHTHKLTFICK